MKRKLFLLLITLSISFYTFGKIEDGGFDLKTRINKETKTLMTKMDMILMDMISMVMTKIILID